jgi:hypothetical protein
VVLQTCTLIRNRRLKHEELLTNLIWVESAELALLCLMAKSAVSTVL